MERRTLIRLLVGLGIGIPVLVEVLTFLGLVETRLFEGDEGTPTPGPGRVGVGDELLPDTPATETVTEGVVRGQDTPWVFVLTVEVENAGASAYALQLGSLTLGTGRTVAGGASTGRLPPGGSGQVTGAWEIPQGSTPDALDVVAVEYTDGGTTETSTRVPLASFPVRGG